MHTKTMIRVLYAAAFIAAASGSACGGQSQSPPPETPPPVSEPVTEPRAGNEAADDEGQHTMPDGTTMPGDHHGDSTHPPEGE